MERIGAGDGARRRRTGWIADVVVGLLVVAAAWAVAVYHPEFVATPIAVVVMVLPAAVIPFRRLWPTAVLAACVALYVVAAFLGALSPGITLAAGVAMYHVATRTPRRRTVLTTLAAIVVVLLLRLPAELWNILDPRELQFALTMALAAAAGDAVRSRRAMIEAITERAERAERTREAEARRRVSEERLRIARDLHDTVAHEIAVISLNAGVASSALEGSPDRAREALGTIRGAARTVLGEIGDLLAVLRQGEDAEEPETLGSIGHIRDLVAQFETTGMVISLRIEGDPDAVSGAVGLVAYRVVQEGLTNAHKHGAEARAHVLLRVDATRAQIVVTNPTTAGLAPEGMGVGLVGMRERVASVRGTMQTDAGPGTFTLRVELPLPRTETP